MWYYYRKKFEKHTLLKIKKKRDEIYWEYNF